MSVINVRDLEKTFPNNQAETETRYKLNFFPPVDVSSKQYQILHVYKQYVT